ncbi:MAG: hypothetical protein K8U03_25160 [Planctomycetia bacterium]|nr:hypothetical protein [Planctomycetia bacterium]
MAREEEDKEDLLREATALVERVELLDASHEGEPHSIVVGFRRDGAASYFFGSDPVYQFNTRRELRRGFHSGKLLKAERGRLVELTRTRTETETGLERRELSEEHMGELLDDIRLRLSALVAHWLRNGYSLVGQVPAGTDVMKRVIAETEAILLEDIVVADSPGLR